MVILKVKLRTFCLKVLIQSEGDRVYCGSYQKIMKKVGKRF